MKLSIIIVDYNAKKYIFECLKSIKKNLKNINYEIIIVDNKSKDELKITNQELSDLDLAFDFKLLTLNSNIGFGGGNNAGARISNGEYLLLLNPDTLIIDDSVNKMLHFVETHKKIGAVVPLLYQEDGVTLQKSFFGKFQSLLGLTILRNNQQKTDLSKEFLYSDIVTGAALMIKKELFDKMNGFDENIFMYLEDDDLCKRIADLGYKNAVFCKAKIIHLEGKSSNNKEKKKFYYKSQDYYWQKHKGFLPTHIMKLLRWPIKVFKTRN